MENEDKELKIYSIITGKTYLTYKGQEYHTVINTPEEKYRASLVYQQTLDDLKYESIMSWEEAQRVSNQIGIWTKENESGLESLIKMLEDLKLQLYRSRLIPDRVKSFKSQIEKVKHGIEKSNTNKYKLYHATKEYYASVVKKQYLVGLSIRDEDNQQIYTHKNFWVSDNTLIDLFINKIFENQLSMSSIRELARNEPWRSMWATQKGQVFGISSTCWTDDQRVLASFSRMYDNVYESMESPEDTVIEDDDMLDGWFIHQRKEREKSKQEKVASHMFKGQKNGNQELFLMANSQESAQAIYNMNDEQGKSIVQNRQQQIKNKGYVEHSELADVQLDLKLQANQELREKMRKR